MSKEVVIESTFSNVSFRVLFYLRLKMVKKKKYNLSYRSHVVIVQ